MPTPDPALQARLSVAAARVGLLTTYARHPAGQTTTTVRVQPGPDGTLQFDIGRTAVAARQLLARPAATLQLRPTGHAEVLLHGAVRRLPTSAGGTLRFHVEVAAVRVGAPAVLLDEQEYLAAQPDALAAEAPGVLAHLNAHHRDALTACLRAMGHQGELAVATALDGGGLGVAVLSADGVERVRLTFPTQVTALSQLPASLSLLLDPQCTCRPSGDVHQKG